MRDSGLKPAQIELNAIVNQFDGKHTVGGGLMEGIKSILEITCE